MGTGNGNRGRTGARRFPVAGTADTPPQGEGSGALADWIQNSDFDLDDAVLDEARDIAFGSGEIDTAGSSGSGMLWRDLTSDRQQIYIREALTNKTGLAGDLANARMSGFDATTAQLVRTAMLPVARREQFYWQSAFTHDQLKPQRSQAREAVSRLRNIERTSTNNSLAAEAGRFATRISQAYGLEGRPGVVGIKPGATGRGPFSLVTTPRLQKFDPDRIES